jgi:hypothetical protein
MEESSNLRRWLRKIQANKLRYEVTRDPVRIHDFYHSMYLPYVSQRYGEEGHAMPLTRLKNNMHRLELLLVSQGPTCIAGTLLFYDKEGGVANWMSGKKEGDPAYLRTGAGYANYYYSILYLAENGFKKLKCGWSRSFLDDGVLQYKKSWGLRLVDTYGSGSLVIALNDSPQTRAFFASNPLIGVTDDKLTGMLFMPPGDVPSEPALIKLHRKYYITGMGRLRVLTSGDPAQHPAVPDELGGELTVESADDFFQASAPAPM